VFALGGLLVNRKKEREEERRAKVRAIVRKGLGTR
jgi:hypothetical protein